MSGFLQRALTDDDAAECIALLDAISEADGDEYHVDEESYRFLLHHPLGTPGVDGHTGFFDGKRLVAAGWVTRRTAAEPAHWMSSDGGVHPGYRGRGLGTRLVRWQEELAPVIHERWFPGAPLELSRGALEGNTGARELFEREGYAPLRCYFHMRRPEGKPLGEPRIPDGLVFETYTPAMREQLRVLHNEVFSEHFRFTLHTPEDWNHWIGQDKIRPELSFLLRDAANGRIAGYLMSSFEKSAFERTGVRDIHFNLIGTSPAYRKRGVASALITHAVRESRRLGYQTASLGVDAENATGALGVYERNGFECARTFVSYNKVLVPGR